MTSDRHFSKVQHSFLLRPTQADFAGRGRDLVIVPRCQMLAL